MSSVLPAASSLSSPQQRPPPAARRGRAAVAAALLAIYAAGVVTGAAGWNQLYPSHRRRDSRDPQRLAATIKQMLRRELSLSAQQEQRIGPSVDRVSQELAQLNAATHERVVSLFNQADQEIIPELTPDQRNRLQEIRRRHRQDDHPPR